MINEAIQYLVKNIKEHPSISAITAINIIAAFFTFVSTFSVDNFAIRQAVKANADQITQLSNIVSSDHTSIIILQQIAKDSVNAQQNLSNEVQQFHADFEQYLLNKVK